jgi:hypothetical protein
MAFNFNCYRITEVKFQCHEDVPKETARLLRMFSIKKLSGGTVNSPNRKESKQIKKITVTREGEIICKYVVKEIL